MIVTKAGDRLCGYTPALASGEETLRAAGYHPPDICTKSYGHHNHHVVHPDVWRALFRDGYTYYPDPDPPDSPEPCEASACFLPHNHDGPHVTAWYDLRIPSRTRCHHRHSTLGACIRPKGHPGWHGRPRVNPDRPNIWPPDDQEDTTP